MNEWTAARIVEMAIRLWRRDEGALEWIARFGRECRKRDGELTAVGPSGIRCGFLLGADPITNAVMMGFYFAGPFWPYVWPRLLEKTDAAWRKARHDARRSEGHGPKTLPLGRR